MKDLKLGDITVKDKGSLGCDFYIGEHRIMWLNDRAEDQLVWWLGQKPKAKGEISRQSSGRIRPAPKRKKDGSDNRPKPVPIRDFRGNRQPAPRGRERKINGCTYNMSELWQ